MRPTREEITQRLLRGVQEARAKFPEGELAPKFLYLHMVSQAAATGDQIELRRQLQAFAEEYNGTDPAVAARALMAALDAQNPEVFRVVAGGACPHIVSGRAESAPRRGSVG